MYIVYYDSGTTNTRAYLLKDGKIVHTMSEAVGAKNSALEKDNTRLVGELYDMYKRLMDEEGITEEDISHVYLSGMISSPSGIVEVEHLPVPVDADCLRGNLEKYYDSRFFKRELEIVPGIKTLERGVKTSAEMAAGVNIMRGEEIEVLGVLRANPEFRKGSCVLVLPGSHTQAVLVKDGCIENISSNITGEFFKAITKESILGASVAGDEKWEINGEMICMGGANVHTYGFNRAMYILRILDLFSDAGLNMRRSYFEGALNVGVMDAVTEMLKDAGEKLEPRSIRMAVIGDEIQKQIYKAFCQKDYQHFELIEAEPLEAMPYSVGGLLEICNIK